MNRELWKHQQQGLDDLRATIQQGVRRVVMQAPTGAGKTLMAAAIVDGAIRKGNRLAFIVNAIGLIDQTVEAFYAEGIRDIGVIQANHSQTNWAKPVQVCSIQTLKSRNAYPEAKTVIFDECHSLHDFHKQWLGDAAWQNVPFIGLSATPWSKGLGKYFHSLLVVATTQELIDKGFLSKFKVYCTGQPDLSEVKVVAGEYVSNQLSDAMCKGTLTADIVDTWKRMWGKQNTIVFGVDRRHAETLHYRFQDIGVRSAYQDGETSAADRAQIKRDFHNGQLDVVCNIGTLTTGVDWDVRCLVLARPTKSEILYTQIIGRALRTATGKDHALILDHSNSTLELGLVTSIHHDHLDDGKPKKEAVKTTRKKPLPRPCPQCNAIVPRLNRTCTECGHQLPLMSDVVERDGVLVPYDEAKVTGWAGRNHTRSEKLLWLAMLKGYAQQHGKDKKWVLANYKEKFTHPTAAKPEWPPWGSVDSTPAVEPSIEIFTWVTSRKVKWANSKKQNGQHLQAAE